MGFKFFGKTNNMKSGKKIKISSGNCAGCVEEANEKLSLRSTGTMSHSYQRSFLEFSHY